MLTPLRHSSNIGTKFILAQFQNVLTYINKTVKVSLQMSHEFICTHLFSFTFFELYIMLSIISPLFEKSEPVKK